MSFPRAILILSAWAIAWVLFILVMMGACPMTDRTITEHVALTSSQVKALKALAKMADSESVQRFGLNNVAIYRVGSEHVVFEVTNGCYVAKIRMASDGESRYDSNPFALVNAKMLIKALPTIGRGKLLLTIRGNMLLIGDDGETSIRLSDARWPSTGETWVQPKDSVAPGNYNYQWLAGMGDIVTALSGPKADGRLLDVQQYGTKSVAVVTSPRTDNFAGIIMPIAADRDITFVMPSWAIGGQS